MNFKKFMELYANYNGNLVVNDDDLDLIVKGRVVSVMDNRKDLWNMEVVVFDFLDNELCVRVR